MARAVGIDLGTTNSVVAILEGRQPVVIPNAEGGRTTPSVVAFDKDGVPLVGELAKRQAVTNVARTVRSIKRQVGAEWSIEVDGHRYSAPQVLALVLSKLKRDAEAYLGEDVTSAVVTVPAYFNDAQRQATRDAGVIAGLDVSRIVNEPTAAAVAYGLDATEGQSILVFDLGGGTFDVSLLIVERDEDGFTTVQVVATSGDNHLGGDDWDNALVDELATRFAGTHGIDLRQDPVAVQRLTEAAEVAKVNLSASPDTQIHLPYITAGPDGPLHLEEVVTRAEFEDLTRELLQRCRGPVERVLLDGRQESVEVDQVILVGGSSRMPAVAQLVRDLTGKEASRSVNPDEVVAVGAAQQAGVLSGQRADVLLIDVTPLTLGIETRGGLLKPIIERNTAIPVRRSQLFTTSAENQTTVNIRAFQGERELAEHNALLGNFALTGLPPLERGVPKIEVVFDIDANGIVTVTATDQATGQRQEMTVTGSSRVPPEEVERMVAEAARFAEQDRRSRDLVTARNEFESLRHGVEAFLERSGEQLAADVTAPLLQCLTLSAQTVAQASEARDVRLQINAVASAALEASRVLNATHPNSPGVPAGPDGPDGRSGPRAAPPLPEGRDETSSEDRSGEAGSPDGTHGTSASRPVLEQRVPERPTALGAADYDAAEAFFALLDDR
ncbi:MAG: molecular chaperone DnaK [Actinomycetes bacterium]